MACICRKRSDSDSDSESESGFRRGKRARFDANMAFLRAPSPVLPEKDYNRVQQWINNLQGVSFESYGDVSIDWDYSDVLDETADHSEWPLSVTAQVDRERQEQQQRSIDEQEQQEPEEEEIIDTKSEKSDDSCQVAPTPPPRKIKKKRTLAALLGKVVKKRC